MIEPNNSRANVSYEFPSCLPRQIGQDLKVDKSKDKSMTNKAKPGIQLSQHIYFMCGLVLSLTFDV